MAALVDKKIQDVSTRSGVTGYGFNLRDSTGMRFITLTYATAPEAKAARDKIEEAVAGAVEAYITDGPAGRQP
jgi:hypothetical protein